MKKIAVFITVLLFPVLLFSETVKKFELDADGTVKAAVFYENSREIAREIFDANMNIIKKKGRIPDGIVIQYDDNGNLYAEYAYKKNLLAGISKTYYDNGKVMSEDTYKNDKLNGVSRQYYSNGILKVAEFYKDNLRDGESKEYEENGKEKSLRNYAQGKLIKTVKEKQKKMLAEGNSTEKID